MYLRAQQAQRGSDAWSGMLPWRAQPEPGAASGPALLHTCNFEQARSQVCCGRPLTCPPVACRLTALPAAGEAGADGQRPGLLPVLGDTTRLPVTGGPVGVRDVKEEQLVRLALLWHLGAHAVYLHDVPGRQPKRQRHAWTATLGRAMRAPRLRHGALACWCILGPARHRLHAAGRPVLFLPSRSTQGLSPAHLVAVLVAQHLVEHRGPHRQRGKAVVSGDDSHLVLRVLRGRWRQRRRARDSEGQAPAALDQQHAGSVQEHEAGDDGAQRCAIGWGLGGGGRPRMLGGPRKGGRGGRTSCVRQNSQRHVPAHSACKHDVPASSAQQLASAGL